MPLHCLKVTLKTEDLKFLHSCISKITEDNIALEARGEELFYGYLPAPPPFEIMCDYFNKDESFKFFFNHPVFGYYLFFETTDLNSPIGFMAIGLSGSEIEGFVNKSTHFIQSKMGKGYGSEAFNIVLEKIKPFIGQNVKFPYSDQLMPFKGISASVNIKNTASIIINVRKMQLYDYREREQVRTNTTGNKKERWLSHGLYFYYTTLPGITPARFGTLDLQTAESYLKTMSCSTGAKRTEENKQFQETQTLFLLNRSLKERTKTAAGYIEEAILPKTETADVNHAPIIDKILEYMGPLFRI